MRTFALLVCVLVAGVVAVASAQPSTTHYGGGYGGGYSSRVGAISVWNPSTEHYEPVTSDKQYTYYRLKFHLIQTFTDTFQPDPTSPFVISSVASGDVYDNSTGAKIGTWDSSLISTAVTAKGELQHLSTTSLELGPDGDDTVVVASAFELAIVPNQGPVDQAPTDHDAAVTGGTGRYRGATGEMQHAGGPSFVGPETTFVAELAVPRFKRF